MAMALKAMQALPTVTAAIDEKDKVDCSNILTF
jgi:hypothetical protein